MVGYLGEKNFLTGTDVRMVDFLLFETIETLKFLSKSDRIFTEFPTLRALHARVAALPGLAEYLASDQHIARPYFPSMIEDKFIK